MRKLIKGIVEFRHHVQPDYKETFAKLALGQKPDALLVACSDSRVVPNLFASTDPGDLFVVRNVGNMIPPCCSPSFRTDDCSEGAALEFAVANLAVKDIIICGHSQCGAMQALASGEQPSLPHLSHWLRHGEDALRRLRSGEGLASSDGESSFDSMAEHNRLSQLNVLQQIEHLKGYQEVQRRLDAGTLEIHGWWFDIAKADVYTYDKDRNRFVLIEDSYAQEFLEGLI